ncbi:MAG: Dabb family protein [Chthoniobacter sp.]|nr:Dabb family protein [Chthoniobacter sp.]
MVHHITLCKLQPDVSPAELDKLMRTTRMSLLKIPEILSVRCGKNLDPESEWPFFVALDFESLEKLAMTEEDAIYMKFIADVLRPHTSDRLVMNYEMEPGKNLKYS